MLALIVCSPPSVPTQAILTETTIVTGRTVLEAGDRKAGGAKMFDKGELAAILRFGAEALFQQDAEVRSRLTVGVAVGLPHVTRWLRGCPLRAGECQAAGRRGH